MACVFNSAQVCLDMCMDFRNTMRYMKKESPTICVIHYHIRIIHSHLTDDLYLKLSLFKVIQCEYMLCVWVR